MARSTGRGPNLARARVGALAFWTDGELFDRTGVRIAFTERTGGVSGPPFSSLDLAAHVGDDPGSVDRNRDLLLEAVGLGSFRDRLTTADQVHGTAVATVDEQNVGAGANARGGEAPIAATDVLMTATKAAPLLMCYADCVPIVLVAPGPAVSVVHAGWRGVLGELPASAARLLAAFSGTTPDGLLAYVGPHVGACCYEVGDEILSQFVNTFGTVARAESGALDLGSVVNESLTRVGVPSCSIAHLGACTAQKSDRFFSYRAEHGMTGRHGALACIVPRG